MREAVRDAGLSRTTFNTSMRTDTTQYNDKYESQAIRSIRPLRDSLP